MVVCSVLAQLYGRVHVLPGWRRVLENVNASAVLNRCRREEHGTCGVASCSGSGPIYAFCDEFPDSKGGNVISLAWCSAHVLWFLCFYYCKKLGFATALPCKIADKVEFDAWVVAIDDLLKEAEKWQHDVGEEPGHVKDIEGRRKHWSSSQAPSICKCLACARVATLIALPYPCATNDAAVDVWIESVGNGIRRGTALLELVDADSGLATTLNPTVNAARKKNAVVSSWRVEKAAGRPVVCVCQVCTSNRMPKVLCTECGGTLNRSCFRGSS